MDSNCWVLQKYEHACMFDTCYKWNHLVRYSEIGLTQCKSNYITLLKYYRSTTYTVLQINYEVCMCACMVYLSVLACCMSLIEYDGSNAVVTPLRKAALYEPRIAILGIWGDTWLTRGKYGIYVVVTGVYVMPSAHVKSALSTGMSPTWR